MHSLHFCLKHLSAPEATPGPGTPPRTRTPQQMKPGQVQLKIIQARIALNLQRKSPCPCALSHPAGTDAWSGWREQMGNWNWNSARPTEGNFVCNHFVNELLLCHC